MDWKSLSGRRVAVTGAASGIGRASALAFARRGADLELCDLNASGLEACADEATRAGAGSVHVRAVDVADAAQVRAWADAVHARAPALDVLMNNAGVAIGGGFLDTSLEDWEWILGVNVRGVVHGCHAFLPAMVARGAGGHVINVASAAGLVGSAALAAYCTTKFSVVGLSESLRDELHRHRIGVTCVCPGLIDTPITRATRYVGAMAGDGVRDEIEAIYRRRGYGPERVAANVLRAAERNRAIAPITPEAWAIHWAKRLAPGLLERVARAAAARSRRRLGIVD